MSSRGSSLGGEKALLNTGAWRLMAVHPPQKRSQVLLCPSLPSSEDAQASRRPLCLPSQEPFTGRPICVVLCHVSCSKQT